MLAYLRIYECIYAHMWLHVCVYEHTLHIHTEIFKPFIIVVRNKKLTARIVFGACCLRGFFHVTAS
jgi:hypothetical protein